MGALFTRMAAPVGRTGLAILFAAAIVWPALSAPAAARGPDSIADVAEAVIDAVVNVSTKQTVDMSSSAMPQLPPGSPFEEFFEEFFKNRRGQNGQGGAQPPRRVNSLGSGFIIDSSGLVVTNNHVIADADEISVILNDGTTLKADIVGRDTKTDLALLKVKPDKPLKAVKFGDSDKLRLGEWVIAIGNPFSLGGTVTAGIVSARNRDINSGPYDNYIQTDAAINRGNSGGPLFNLNGEVIGVNTAIISPSGGSIGIGFAVPSKTVVPVIDQLREFKEVRRGWLGVRIQQVTPDIAESLGLHDATGAMVAGVNDGGPADKAKIHNGDIILKFNGQDVKEMRSLPRIVADSEVGKSVPAALWRDGKEVTVQAMLAEKPDDVQVASATSGEKPAAEKPTEISGLGMKLAPITQDMKDKFSLNADQKGVVITDVSPNSPAAERGLKPGDVVVEVQQGEVTTPADVQQKVDSVRKESRKSVLMLIQRQDGLQWVPLSLSGDKDKQPG